MDSLYPRHADIGGPAEEDIEISNLRDALMRMTERAERCRDEREAERNAKDARAKQLAEAHRVLTSAVDGLLAAKELLTGFHDQCANKDCKEEGLKMIGLSIIKARELLGVKS
jgi:hypothetical protein